MLIHIADKKYRLHAHVLAFCVRLWLPTGLFAHIFQDYFTRYWLMTAMKQPWTIWIDLSLLHSHWWSKCNHNTKSTAKRSAHLITYNASSTLCIRFCERGIHWLPVISLHKWPEIRKIVSCNNVIMSTATPTGIPLSPKGSRLSKLYVQIWIESDKAAIWAQRIASIPGEQAITHSENLYFAELPSHFFLNKSHTKTGNNKDKWTKIHSQRGA